MGEALAYLHEFNIVSVTLRLVLAMVSGGMIGMERGRKRRAVLYEFELKEGRKYDEKEENRTVVPVYGTDCCGCGIRDVRLCRLYIGLVHKDERTL